MASLDEILRHPVMKMAIEIVKAESVGLPDPIPGVDYQSTRGGLWSVHCRSLPCLRAA